MSLTVKPPLPKPVDGVTGGVELADEGAASDASPASTIEPFGENLDRICLARSLPAKVE